MTWQRRTAFPYGLGLLLLTLASTSVGCSSAEAPPAQLRFDGERAYADLVDLVRIGPRPSGSEGAQKARELIADRLRQAGFAVEEQVFRAGPPGGTAIELRNVVGTRGGARPQQILLITHYDTKAIPGVRFVGANDGASGAAVLLELARQIPPGQHELGLSLVFFDGEEAFGPNIDDVDGLFGSRWLAEKMHREGKLGSIAALVLIDMVGDRDLNLAVDLSSSPHLRQLLRTIAKRVGLEGLIDPLQTFSLIDDHTPFVDRGVSNALALIDFQFGARSSPGPLWHTSGDDLPAVAAESLNRVGGLLVELLREIDSDTSDFRGAPEPLEGARGR